MNSGAQKVSYKINLSCKFYNVKKILSKDCSKITKNVNEEQISFTF